MSKVIQLLFGISKSGTQQLAVALDDEVLDLRRVQQGLLGPKTWEYNSRQKQTKSAVFSNFPIIG